MARKTPKAETLRLLYVRSGNKCAFPDCEHPIFNDKGTYIAQLCHIKAANFGGSRFEKEQSDEERCSYENLMFMCHRHHKETDDDNEYTVEKLAKIKRTHEAKFTEEGRVLTNQMISQVLFEINYFWNKQRTKTFELDDLKIERNFDLSIIQLFSDLEDNIKTIEKYCDLCATSDESEEMAKDLKKLFNIAGIEYSKVEKVHYRKNPFVSRNWEMHNIGRPNFFSHTALCLNQLKVKVIEELLKLQPDNKELNEYIKKCRASFEDLYDEAYYVD